MYFQWVHAILGTRSNTVYVQVHSYDESFRQEDHPIDEELERMAFEKKISKLQVIYVTAQQDVHPIAMHGPVYQSNLDEQTNQKFKQFNNSEHDNMKPTA